ncbi:MAG: Tm-1-like ATP-binding domain-containing protein, partial [Pseudomonadota bacterium]
MNKKAAIAVVGTLDSKGEEHLFLKKCIEQRGFPALTVNVGTKHPPLFPPDMDLFPEILREIGNDPGDRDRVISLALQKGRDLVRKLYGEGAICGMISAGGGTGTHLGTGIMRVLPLGVPKVMVSTVASRNMAAIVGTKDIVMMHSVVDILGVNSISGVILENAAGAVCGMVDRKWRPPKEKKRIA